MKIKFFLSEYLVIQIKKRPVILNFINIKKSFLISLFFCFFHIGTVAEKTSLPFPVDVTGKAVFSMELIYKSLFFSKDPFGGTAFVIEIEGSHYLVTNFHIIYHLNFGKVVSSIRNKIGQTLEMGTIEGLSFLYDLAIIKINKGYKGSVLKLADRDKNAKKAYMMGFPLGQFETVEFSEVSEISSEHFCGVTDDIKLLKGSSGGPAFNEKGEVIGIAVTGSKYDMEFIKSSFIRRTLNVKRGSHGKLKQWIQREIDTVEEMALRGDPLAQVVWAEHMHRLYKETKDDKYIQEALSFYKRAATQGYFKAQVSLGLIYVELISEGVLENPLQYWEESEKWLRLAVEQKKSIVADFSLALLLTTVKRNSKRHFMEGRDLLQKLSDRGFKPAREFLEVLESRDQVIKQNPEEKCENSFSYTDPV